MLHLLHWYHYLVAYIVITYLVGWFWFGRGWENRSGVTFWALVFSPIVVPILALREVLGFLRRKTNGS